MRTTMLTCCGCLVGVALSFAFGAAAPALTIPRYAVQYSGPVLLITDHQTNKLYIYENTGANSALRQYIDLTQTGKAEITATQPEAGAP